MNFLRKLTGTGVATPQRTIEPGQLWLIRNKNSPKGTKELIFRDSSLSIVTNEDGNAQLLAVPIEDDKDDGNPDALDALEQERLFLVDERLRLAYMSRDLHTVVSWRDLDGDSGDRYEFVCGDNVSPEALRRFDESSRKAQYVRKYNKDPTDTASLDEFDFDDELLASLKPKPEDVKDELTAEQFDEKSKATVAAPLALTLEPLDPTPGEIRHKAQASLFYFDTTKGTFINEKNEIEAVIIDVGAFKFWLEVRHAGKALLSVAVSSELNSLVDEGRLSFIFNYSTSDSNAITFLLKFTEAEQVKKFQQEFSLALWQAQTRQDAVKVAERDRDYISDAFGNLKLVDDDDDANADEEDDDEEAEEEETPAATDNADKLANEFFNKQTARFERNSALEVGGVNDRSYVVRGNNIGVFKNTDELEYSTTIANIVDTAGVKLNPRKIMLHEADRQLILQNEDKPDHLYKMDLEYGKVVEDWDFGRNLTGYAPTSKFAQATGEDLLLGLGTKSLFKIDPRLSGAKIVSDADKVYSTNPKFTALATTADGYVAVGAVNGAIRLYNKLGSIAKTEIPGLGDPVLGIDVTSDGHWIVATFKTYLLLIEAVNKEHNGFVKSFPKDKKPRPRRLQISPENAAFMRAETKRGLSFTKAYFDTGPDAKEQTIVTSTGPYVVTWNLKGVLRYESNPYLIKRYTSNVMADNFKYGTDKRVIVAFEDDVDIVAKSSLRKANRQTLASRPI